MVGLKEEYEQILNKALEDLQGSAQKQLAQLCQNNQWINQAKLLKEAHGLCLSAFDFDAKAIQSYLKDYNNDIPGLTKYIESQLSSIIPQIVQAQVWVHTWTHNAMKNYKIISKGNKKILAFVRRESMIEVLFDDKENLRSSTKQELQTVQKKYKNLLLFYVALKQSGKAQALSLDDLYRISQQKNKILKSCEQKIAFKPESVIDDINKQINSQIQQIQKEKIIEKRIWIIAPCAVVVINLALFFFGKPIVSDWINAATCLVAGFMVAYNLMRSALLLSSLSKIILGLQIGLGVGLLLIGLTSALFHPETFAWIANIVKSISFEFCIQAVSVLAGVDVFLLVILSLTHYAQYTRQLSELHELLHESKEEPLKQIFKKIETQHGQKANGENLQVNQFQKIENDQQQNFTEKDDSNEILNQKN